MDLSQLKLSNNLVPDAQTKQLFNDINGIAGLTTNSISSLQALIFPQKNINEDIDPTDPQNVGITAYFNGKKQGFIFDLKQDYRINLNSDITDHYVENNIAIQDHIALRPITIEVSGKISEVNLNTPYDEEGETDTVKNTLNTIDSYYSRMGSLPQFAPNIVSQARDILNTAKSAYNTYKTFAGFVKIFSGEQKQTRQSKIVSMFKKYWENRTKFVVVTPFCVLENMYILDFSANQPQNTKFITEIRIKFKQIREAEVITVKSRFKSQGAEIAANKKSVEESSSYLGQSPNPLETEEKMAGDFVKQSLNVAQQPFIITKESIEASLDKVLVNVGDRMTGLSNISTIGMSAPEVANVQILSNNMSLLPNKPVATGFMIP